MICLLPLVFLFQNHRFNFYLVGCHRKHSSVAIITFEIDVQRQLDY
jgi:hypothetical protein